MLEIYLIRHGLTSWNKEKRFQGSQDIPLAKEGIIQAEKTKNRVKNLHFTAVYSSDLQRAYQTARIIADSQGLAVTSLPEIREICMGDWEGMIWDEIEREYSEILQVWKTTPSKAEVPNGERLEEVGRRAYRTLWDLAQKHKDDQRILLVSHGVVIGTILCQITGLSLDEWYRSYSQGNTAVNVIQFDGEMFHPVLINCTRHCS